MPTITRRQTLRLGAGAGLALAMFDGGVRAAAAAPPTFSLLLVNDIYNLASVQGRGGFARLAAVVKAERARGVPMLFCHAGDTFSPSLMSGLDKGSAIVEVTNLLAPDVFVPGNHEFDFGLEVFFQRMEESKFPYFAANMRRGDGSPVAGMRDTAMVKLGPINVGIIGLALAITPKVAQTGDLVFAPEVQTLGVHAAALRARGADFLVCVAHTARPVDYEIVRSGLVDVLLSGHDHDLAIEYAGTTLMVESSEDAHYVTAIDFATSIKGEGKDRKVSWDPSFRVHDTSLVEPDAAMAAAIARLEGGLATELEVAIGTTATQLDSRGEVVRSREAAIGDLIADALRASTGAQVGLINGGAIRGDKIYPAGSRLTRRDILTELPFGNTTVLVKITGGELHDALENGVSEIDRYSGRFPQVSGLRFVYDPKAPVGARVISATVADRPLDAAKLYTVASNNYLLSGRDGYTALARGKILLGGTDGKMMSNELMAYIRARGTIAPRVDGRITPA